MEKSRIGEMLPDFTRDAAQHAACIDKSRQILGDATQTDSNDIFWGKLKCNGGYIATISMPNTDARRVHRLQHVYRV